MRGKGYKSYRDIAKDFDNLYVHNTFRKWMREDFPKVFRAMSSEDPDGDFEFVLGNPDDGLFKGAQEDLSNVVKRYASIKDERLKGELIRNCEITLKQLRENISPDYKQYEDEF